MSANRNSGPYLYGHWITLGEGLWDEKWGRGWNVRLDAEKYDWNLAQWWLSRLLALPDNVAEAEIRTCVYAILASLFPKSRYPDIAVEYRLGNGHADIYCHRTVFEIKKRGNLDGKRSESSETPEEQALRYLKPLDDNFSVYLWDQWDHKGYVPRCCVTDGVEWRFYYYDSKSGSLLPYEMLHCSMMPRRASWARGFDYAYDVDEIGLLYKLHSFVSRKECGEFIP